MSFKKRGGGARAAVAQTQGVPPKKAGWGRSPPPPLLPVGVALHRGKASVKHGASRCRRPAVTPGHGQPQLLVPPVLGGTEAPQGQEHGWEEMTAPTAMGLPPIWFLSVLNRRAEAGASISTASSVHPHPAPDTCCAMQAAPAHPSSASPQSDEPPQAPRSLYQPQVRQDSWPPTSPGSAAHPAADQGTPQHPAPSLPAWHPLAFPQSVAGGSPCPRHVPVRVCKKLPVPLQLKSFSEKQCRLQARV